MFFFFLMLVLMKKPKFVSLQQVVASSRKLDILQKILVTLRHLTYFIYSKNSCPSDYYGRDEILYRRWQRRETRRDAFRIILANFLCARRRMINENKRIFGRKMLFLFVVMSSENLYDIENKNEAHNNMLFGLESSHNFKTVTVHRSRRR